MAASLSSDGKIWALCRYCRIAISRYPNSLFWRDVALNTDCPDSPVGKHSNE